LYKTKAYAAVKSDLGAGPTTIARRDPGEPDVLIDILFCGICSLRSASRSRRIADHSNT
jgi:D-arabinose 1-dehydrogenase-like Zn-dependent alcohol dehydrogenase